MDDTHNTLITMGNGGDERTRAQLTLFYNGGQSKYRVEKLLPPSQQVWLNLGEMLRNQLPDSDGKTLPPEVMFGSYELRDLDHPVLGLLYEGKLVVDKTYGHASYGCIHCCGYSSAQVSPTPFSGPPGMDNPDTYQAYSVCNSHWDDFDFATNWHSTNTAVATLPNSTLHTVAVGRATGSARNTLAYQQYAGYPCPNEPMIGEQPVTVLPTIQQISPPTGQQGTTVPVVISGNGFGSTTGSLTTTAGSQIGVAKGTWNDGTINATFTINSSTAAQSYTVVVTTSSTASCPGCQATTSFYVTAQCNPSVVATAQTISCDRMTVHEGKLTISGANEANVTDTVVSAQSSSVLNLDLQGLPYKDSTFCSSGQICYGQNYIGYQEPGANINWNVQIFCSNSPYPSVTVTPSETITCQ